MREPDLARYESPSSLHVRKMVATTEDEPKEEKKVKQKKVKEIELTPKKTALGDTATIKRIMDDAVISVVLDKEEGQGYLEDTSMSNLKLVIGFAGVGSSLLSHVYPATFPRNWWVLLFCCAFYFAMSGVLQLLLSFVELESILIVRGKSRPDGTKRSGINISTHFPRFQEMFTLGLTPVAGGAFSLASGEKFRPDIKGGNTAPLCLQRSWCVASYFDEDGLFAELEFMAVSASA